MFQPDLFSSAKSASAKSASAKSASAKFASVKFVSAKFAKAKSAKAKSAKTKKAQGFSVLADLPDYKIRVSQRAKHVSLKISVEGELEVVVPPGFDCADLPEILERRREWIMKARSRVMSAAKSTAADWTVAKPDVILLRWRSTNLSDVNCPDIHLDKSIESWSVAYRPSAGNQTRCIPSLNSRLTIRGNTEQVSACQAVLRQWLSHRAHRELIPWLRQLGYELDLPCRYISIRGQKTRWASCSSEKDISLNYKLLFLPQPMVHYVLVHELCHTVHMNHSNQFWALVGDKLPDYKRWVAELKTGWRYVPRWVET
jgi:predicted metal-dependent hydrolase